MSPTVPIVSVLPADWSLVVPGDPFDVVDPWAPDVEVDASSPQPTISKLTTTKPSIARA